MVRAPAWFWQSAELLALVVMVGLALQLRLANIEHYSGSFDEGVRAEQLLLMEAGFRPFREIFASQGPLLLDLLYPFYRAFGETLGAARLGVGMLSLVGLVGAWWIARAVSPLAGLAVAVLLALSPGYLEGSRLALAELPSLAPCLWAVGCALRWQRGGAAGWLYAAAGLAALGVLVKPMALPAIVPLGLLALFRRPTRPLAILGACALALATVAVVLLLLGASSVFEVLGAYRGGALRSAGSAAAQNWALITKVLAVERAGFLALAVLGASLGLAFWPRVTIALVSWPLAQLGLFLLYTDLADKHVAYFIPPLALLGGLGLAAAVRAVQAARIRFAARSALPALVGAAVAVLYLTTIPTLWRADRELQRDADERARRDYDGTREQAALMAALTSSDEFVLTDNPNAAFMARRLVPPWLVDTSGTRVDAGSLTAEVAIREATRFDPTVVVTWRRRLGKLDGFNAWLAARYRLIKTYPGSDPAAPLQLYVRMDLEDRARAFLRG